MTTPEEPEYTTYGAGTYGTAEYGGTALPARPVLVMLAAPQIEVATSASQYVITMRVLDQTRIQTDVLERTTVVPSNVELI